MMHSVMGAISGMARGTTSSCIPRWYQPTFSACVVASAPTRTSNINCSLPRLDRGKGEAMANRRHPRQPEHPSQALAPQPSVTSQSTLLSESDLHYFNEGTHSRLYEKLGAHPLTLDGTRGTYFAV